MRDEKTPSACLRETNHPKYGRVWQATDFGGEGHAENGIDLYMRMHNIGQSRFNEAILALASQFGISDELNPQINKPDTRKRPATEQELDGQRYFETNEVFTEAELKLLGPLVKQEHVDALHWHSLKWIGFCKDREMTIKYSNDNYPIFARECWYKQRNKSTGKEELVCFYKIYEPKNTDKGWRFSYMPKGMKPQRYINGLRELQQAYTKFNEEEREQWGRTHPEDVPYKEQKLKEAFICSGERDSLCIRSLGHNPLWFNSETYTVSDEEYREIMKYVEVLYNIPDIDDTGISKGVALALRFIDIHTVWLPKWLFTWRDHRGKPRKDFRDWIELRPTRKDFRQLIELAMPAKFWTVRYTKGRELYDIDTACLFNFLKLNGFYALHDDNSSTTRYVRITGNIVKTVTVKDIREFVRSWVVDRSEKRDILNLVLNTQRLGSAALESLEEATLDFTSYTHCTQLFFFPECSVEVCPDKMVYYKKEGSSLKNYVWEENVIPHSFTGLDPMFEINRASDIDGNPVFDITIKSMKSNFFAYLVNSSRIYWRKELEYNFEDRSIEDYESYYNKHHFDIAGEGLTDNEVADQKRNLINKIFCLGYMLHHYKSPSRAWAPMAMDNKIGEDNECNGRSGKSFFFKALSLFMKTVKLSGRNPKLMDNPHVFDQVSQHTQMLLLDDCDRYLNTGLFYDNITSDMTVNPKNNQSFTIPFEDSPKIAFTTNYVPADFDPSSEARLLYMVFSDYYHQRTEENDYRETRSIRDDFNKDLFSKSYSPEEWNNDINFILQCCQFYLSLCSEPIKLLPPMDNIIKRKYKADMGTNFEDWAASYFSEESGRLNELLVRENVFADFKQATGVNKITMQAFSKKLRSFVALCPHIECLNPKDMCNSSGRIIRKETIAPGLPQKAVEMIYLKKIEDTTPWRDGDVF